MNAIELMTKLNESPVEDWAAIAANSGVAGAKDVYIAMGKTHNIPLKELNEWWKEAQPAKSTGGAKGFAAEYYDWLADGSRSEQDAHDYIMSNESDNVRNHLTHYLNIWALAETIRCGEPVTRTIQGQGKAKAKSAAKGGAKADAWEYDDSNPFVDVRSAKENLKREQAKAKPRKTRLHPDKVAHLDDAELTKLYTAAFKAYFG